MRNLNEVNKKNYLINLQILLLLFVYLSLDIYGSFKMASIGFHCSLIVSSAELVEIKLVISNFFVSVEVAL